MRKRTYNATPRAQRGAILIVGLVILLIITIFSMSAIRDANLQSKMANNNRERLIALEAANAGLRTAEAFVSSTAFSLSQLDGIGCTSDCFNADCLDGLCFQGTKPGVPGQCTLSPEEKPPWLSTSLSVWSNPARHRSLVASSQIAANVRFIIEFRCYQPAEPDQILTVANAYRVFRITSLAVTPNERGRAMVQSTYRTEHSL